MGPVSWTFSGPEACHLLCPLFLNYRHILHSVYWVPIIQRGPKALGITTSMLYTQIKSIPRVSCPACKAIQMRHLGSISPGLVSNSGLPQSATRVRFIPRRTQLNSAWPELCGWKALRSYSQTPSPPKPEGTLLISPVF